MFRLISALESQAICEEAGDGWRAFPVAEARFIGLYCLLTDGMLAIDDLVELIDLNMVYDAHYTINRYIVQYDGVDVGRVHNNAYQYPVVRGFKMEHANRDWVGAARKALGEAAMETLDEGSGRGDQFTWANWFLQRYDSGFYDPYLLTPRS